MSFRQVVAASDAAQDVVDAFVHDHRATAIPALIGACVLWAVEHGGADLVKSSLLNAMALADQIADEIKAGAQ